MALPQETPTRVLLYSHDSVGLGHIRRNLALAHTLAKELPALTGRPVTGLLVTGTGLATTLDKPDGFDVVVLPGVAKGEGGYEPRNVDVPMADLADVRRRMLGAVIGGFAPDLVIIDRHPYGVGGELRHVLAELRRARPQTSIVLGLREVLDEPEAVAAEWRRIGDLNELQDIFDAIWVFGDDRVHDVRQTREVPRALAGLVEYTGFLSTGRRWLPEDDPTPVPYILTMVGGGSDGAQLCRDAALAQVPAGHRHLIVAGPQMPDAEREQIEALAQPGTRVVGSVPDGLATIRRAAAVISMAGYNTVCELMSTRTPALLVPREHPRQEQLIRATGLAATGTLELLRVGELTPARLTTWLADAVGREVDRSCLDRDGLKAVPALAADLIAARHLEVLHAAV